MSTQREWKNCELYDQILCGISSPTHKDLLNSTLNQWYKRSTRTRRFVTRSMLSLSHRRNNWNSKKKFVFIGFAPYATRVITANSFTNTTVIKCLSAIFGRNLKHAAISSVFTGMTGLNGKTKNASFTYVDFADMVISAGGSICLLITFVSITWLDFAQKDHIVFLHTQNGQKEKINSKDTNMNWF